MLELGVNIPTALWIEDGLKKLIPTSYTTPTNELYLKDVEDKITKNMVMALMNSLFMEETHNKSSYSSWWRNRSRNGLLTFLWMMVRNSLKKSQVLLHPTMEYQKTSHNFFVLTVMLLAVVGKYHKKKEGVLQLFSSPACCSNVMDEDISNYVY